MKKNDVKIIDELTFEYKKNLIFISDYTYEQKKNYCDIIIEKELKKQLTEFTDNNCTNLNISIYEAFNDDITFIRAVELHRPKRKMRQNINFVMKTI